jgi:hypothetical protein
MSEFPWLVKAWNWSVMKWRNSFGTVVLVALAFMLGSAYQTKTITDDCKFSQVFRDGYQAYNCQARAR